MDNSNKGEYKNNKPGINKQVKEYVVSFVIAILVALTLKTYVFARADVQGQSMFSTLNDKDVLFVEKLSLLAHNIKRGEIIIFDSENQNHDIFVKRVIGVAGDTIEIKNDRVYLNNKELQESYLDPNTITTSGTFLKENQPYKIPDGYIFVLGDNRGNSLDSRYLGPINLKDVKGHVIVRAYPFSKMRTF